MAAADDVPALVRLLAGNPVTSAIILTCLNTADATHLRQLHPAMPSAVAGVPRADMDTAVVGVVRWRAAFPAAVGASVHQRPAGGRLDPPALAALAGVTHLDLCGCEFVSSELLRHLPPSLCALNVSCCRNLSWPANITHLAALTVLDCSGTWMVSDGAAGLPPSLRELDMNKTTVFDGASLACLPRIQVLRARGMRLRNDATLASLPATLLELHVAHCDGLLPGTLFAHLPALHTLDVSHSGIGDASLASMPPSLVSLHAYKCQGLTPTAVLPRLPALRLLDVSDSGVGDALVPSLPAGLMELRIADCRGVTAGATFDHVPARRMLQSHSTGLAPGVLAACRARGCVVPAAGVLRDHWYNLTSLALLADGRLATGGLKGRVRVWDVAVSKDEELDWRWVGALAALRDGRRLATAGDGRVEVWDVGVVPPVRTASVGCNVRALAGLRDGRLAAGCDSGAVLIIDIDAGTVAATLGGHTSNVVALAALPDGALATGSWDKRVRVWNVGARTCVATLDGHSGWVLALAVLADGRLASGSRDCTVRLWDVGTRTCVGVLTGHTHDVTALAALLDGRLVSGSRDSSVRVWDTRPATAAAASRAVGAVPMAVLAHGIFYPPALLQLLDGRLAAVGHAVHLLHVPPPAPLTSAE